MGREKKKNILQSLYNHTFDFHARQSVLMCWQLCSQQHPAQRPQGSHFQNVEASFPHKNLENNN